MSLNPAGISASGPLIAGDDTGSAGFERQDTMWMLGLYGTAIGAGTLFLPINAGMHGIWPLLFMMVFAFPMTFLAHRALCRFVLSGASGSSDITNVVVEHFGSKAGNLLTWLYFLSIYPILLMYSVALTNTTNSFLLNQIGLNPPPRGVVALVLVLTLMAIIRFGQAVILKSMSILVYPFITILILLALWLVPHWNTSVFTEGSAFASSGMWASLWLTIPVMVFSFNHSPVISSFAVSQRNRYGAAAEGKCSVILRNSHLLMIMTVLFFVFSCVLALSPADLALAKKQNISILSYLANHFSTPMIAWAAPCIAFVAISKSFLGHYLGASEGLQGILSRALPGSGGNNRVLRLAIDGFMILTCWMVATVNPSILGMIENLGGPVIAMLLFLMPMYAIARIPVLQKYRAPWSDWFTTIMGLTAISAILYGLVF